MARMLLLVAAVLVFAGCGGDEPTRADAETVTGMLNSGVLVQHAMEPLLRCLPEQIECYRAAGANALTVVESEKRRFDSERADTDNECLAEVGRLYSDSLGAYADAARAAAAGKPTRFDRSISRSTQLEIAYNRKLGDCGFAQGEAAEFGAAMRAVNIDMLKLTEEIGRCDDQACVARVARKTRRRAGDGIALIDDFRPRVGESAPSCMNTPLLYYRDFLTGIQRTSSALEQGNVTAAQREGTKADATSIKAAKSMSDCLASLAPE